MTRLELGVLTAFFFGVSACASFAQTSQPAVNADPSISPPAKAHGKKIPHKKTGAVRGSLLPDSDEADKAARLAEGRKKFFEQSSGFENGSTDMPLSMGGNGQPTMGFKF
ncbi:hypothetical protein [Methylocella tundrae]|uniref:Lipoprotein n=1 Tax=Methylocella tundrae TaxID=227605 RepID=A0A4U8YYU8_METTU|nr:hypothetical protein [Methylocella tundrae]WPP06109.1 hypothetical protein SIN04_10015 [Methylocella tundrae]VFU08717.1 exported protein of unknown function [Methylocella tundrae]